MLETIFGIVAGMAIIIVTILLSKQVPAKLIGATTLCAIAFIYVGFSLQNNTIQSAVLEISIALGFFALGVIGYMKHHWLIGLGILLHGVWDILHHNEVMIETTIPSYYPVFCLIVDLISGVYFVLIFRKPLAANN